MSNYILNPSFSSGFNYWNNGAGGLAYAWDAGKARASSGISDTDEKDYRIRQVFTINDEVISGKISVWGQWYNIDGDIDGYTKYRVWIYKPDLSVFYPLTITTKDGEGSGWLLNNSDITANLDQQGNYQIYLQCLVKSAYSQVEDSVQITNNYNTWTNSGFILYDSNSKIKKYSEDDMNEYTATIHKDFTVEETPKSATLKVKALGWYRTDAGKVGQAWLRVRLRDADSNWHTIYNGQQSDGVWKYIVNQSILSYITKAGSYRLEFYTLVQSGRTWNGIEFIYYISYGQFADVNLTVIWDEDQYTQSHGWLDNISVDVAVKKKKVILESLGSIGVPTKKTSLIKSEVLFLSEDCQSNTNKVFRTVSEAVEMVGTYIRKVKKTVKESIGLLESYVHSKLPEYKTVFDELKIFESLFAKKTTGNMEINYVITDLTDWQTISKQSTPWIKTKTEV